MTKKKKKTPLESTVTVIFDPTSQWPLECLSMTLTSLFYSLQTAVTMTSTKDMQTHTHAHSIILPLLFPECQLSLGSFDCIDCTEFSVYMMMNIIAINIIIAATLFLHTSEWE